MSIHIHIHPWGSLPLKTLPGGPRRAAAAAGPTLPVLPILGLAGSGGPRLFSGGSTARCRLPGIGFGKPSRTGARLPYGGRGLWRSSCFIPPHASRYLAGDRLGWPVSTASSILGRRLGTAVAAGLSRGPRCDCMHYTCLHIYIYVTICIHIYMYI